MSKKYLIWKDPNCNGTNPEWIQMTGREFFSFIKREENKNRRFIKLTNEISPANDVLYIESTEKQYKNWIKEKNAHYHLSRINQPYETISMDYPYGDIDHHELHEVISDKSVNVENYALKMKMLISIKKALTKLSSEEFYIIDQMYLCEKAKTERELCKELKITKTTFHRQKHEILKNLKKLMDQN